MAEVSRARGSPPLVGRWPQWRQQVSAATCSRAGDSTAVKETAARPAPAVTAASAARAAITLCTRSRSGFHLPSRGVKSGGLRRRERVRVEQRGQHADRGGLRPAAAGPGQDREADEAGDGVLQPGQRPVTCFLPAPAQHVPVLAQQDQPRPVLECPEQAERDDGAGGVLDPPQQMSAGGGEAEPAVHGGEAAAGEAELPRSWRSPELVGQRVLPVVVAADSP
jgi:hypothetical protein